MKVDTDPGRAREFEVLWILILLVLAFASLSDFLLAPRWRTLAEAWEPADDSEQNGVPVDPWIPPVPANDPSSTQARNGS